MSYLRFVIAAKDEDSGRRQGLFQALFALQYDGALLPHQHDEWRTVLQWFREHLDEPDRFAVSSRTHAKRVAISWFKDSAREHIGQMRRLAAILHDHGVAVDVIRTDRVGYVVYEDEHQVVAEPFADTPT